MMVDTVERSETVVMMNCWYDELIYTVYTNILIIKTQRNTKSETWSGIKRKRK